MKEFVRKNVDKILKDAQSDRSVMKGYVGYLNW